MREPHQRPKTGQPLTRLDPRQACWGQSAFHAGSDASQPLARGSCDIALRQPARLPEIAKRVAQRCDEDGGVRHWPGRRHDGDEYTSRDRSRSHCVPLHLLWRSETLRHVTSRQRDLDAQEIGARLREAREKKRLTQDELAALTGFDRSVISAYENGRQRPGRPNASKLVQALEPHIELEDILYILSPSMQASLTEVAELLDETQERAAAAFRQLGVDVEFPRRSA